MLQYIHYFGRVQSFRGRMRQLPTWARTIIGILAVPGAIFLALSLIAVAVSILVLLLLTVPVYRMLSAVLLGRPVSPETEQLSEQEYVPPNPNRRHVEVKIIE
jgi:hypothetical protein